MVHSRAKPAQTRKKGKSTPQDTLKKSSKRNEQVATPRTRATRNASTKRRRKHIEVPEEYLNLNNRGLPVLPDELLLEIISYFPPVIPKATSTITRDSRGSGFGRREALLCLSLLCRNLRRFVIPFIFETIEVYTGTRVDRGVKDKSLILGGSRDSYSANKEFAIELLRQLHFVNKKNPQLKNKVRAVFVELRGHRLEEVSEELFSSLARFPKLQAIRLEINLPASYYDIRHSSKAQINPALYNKNPLPSVHTLIIGSPFHKFVEACPNLKHLRVFGYNEDPPCHSLRNHHLLIETLYIRRAQSDLLKFVNLRKLIIRDEWASINNVVVTDDMLPILLFPNFPRLQSLHIVIDFRVRRRTIVAPRLTLIEDELRKRQAILVEDKYLCVEYQSPRLRRDYVRLKPDGSRDTDATLIREMF
ncbi:hypothetical protein CVT24_007202 [Panaeolus cyanescens]|uniref:F-box domain-containing protein n=1 Tax=Panaeolus cyanescens TaxID=181874 RepID=A0A409VJP1_9AGAR|nr:hypothetical protein CVT24_007202 [Panaeolus cyanescens]